MKNKFNEIANHIQKSRWETIHLIQKNHVKVTIDEKNDLNSIVENISKIGEKIIINNYIPNFDDIDYALDVLNELNKIKMNLIKKYNLKENMKKSELKQMIQEVYSEIIKEDIKITKSFDKTVSVYQELQLKKQEAVTKFLAEYPKISDAKEKAKYKERYIKTIKDLDAKIEVASDKFNDAVQNLDSAEEEDLL